MPGTFEDPQYGSQLANWQNVAPDDGGAGLGSDLAQQFGLSHEPMQRLPGPAQPKSRWDIFYENIVPDWMKPEKPAEMPPPGTTPGKFGPPSGYSIPEHVAMGLPDILSSAMPGAGRPRSLAAAAAAPNTAQAPVG